MVAAGAAVSAVGVPVVVAERTNKNVAGGDWPVAKVIIVTHRLLVLD